MKKRLVHINETASLSKKRFGKETWQLSKEEKIQFAIENCRRIRITYDDRKGGKGKNTRYHIIMGNPISNVVSEPFEYGLYNAYLKNEEGYLYVYNTTNNKKLTEIEVGTVEFDSGDIYFDVPRDVLSDSLTVICNPMNPDIETYLNNIVRFSSINVKVT